jgi:hypothetical protein
LVTSLTWPFDMSETFTGTIGVRQEWPAAKCLGYENRFAQVAC